MFRASSSLTEFSAGVGSSLDNLSLIINRNRRNYRSQRDDNAEHLLTGSGQRLIPGDDTALLRASSAQQDTQSSLRPRLCRRQAPGAFQSQLRPSCHRPTTARPSCRPTTTLEEQNEQNCVERRNSTKHPVLERKGEQSSSAALQVTIQHYCQSPQKNTSARPASIGGQKGLEGTFIGGQTRR